MRARMSNVIALDGVEIGTLGMLASAPGRIVVTGLGVACDLAAASAVMAATSGRFESITESDVDACLSVIS